MSSQKNILVAFLLNLFFAIFEFFGGIFTGSIAIISDSIHDLGDSLSIAVSYFLEVKSKKGADKNYTYGYTRYSVLGAFITNMILIFGAALTIWAAIGRIITPAEIYYDGMLVFAIIGVIINGIAAAKTAHGEGLNQRAVNLHMLEDVLGWLAVLVASIVMKFTDFYLLDPIMSIGISFFILINAIRGLVEIFDLFLIKVPKGISVDDISEKVASVDGVLDVHHIHLWSLSGDGAYATMHIVTHGNNPRIKEAIRTLLKSCGIIHVTIEIEDRCEECAEKNCPLRSANHHHHHHHHH